MSQKYILATILTALAGTALHFLYQLCPWPLIALFTPVNESVWEHLKLLFWPFFLAACALTRGYADKLRAWSAFLASLLLQPLFLTAVYYLLNCGLGVSSLAIDIALYYVTLALGFYLAWQLEKSGLAERGLGLWIVLASIYGVSLVVFTLAAPDLPIFLG